MEDSKIIELYFERSEEAIPETEAKYGKFCINIANNILGSNEDAEECLNDALLVLWNRIPPEVPSVFSAFIGKITRNIALVKYRRKAAKKRGGNEAEAVLDEISEFVSGGDDVEENIEHREIIAAINEFLAGYPKEKRKIFVSRYWYFMSIEEISEKTGKTEKAIHNILSRTRKKLKKYIEERGFEI